MISRAVGSWVLLSLAFAAGTWIGGWWAVPILGAAWGLVQRPSLHRAPLAGLSAGAGWCMLLGWQALRGPVIEVAEAVAPVLGVSAVPFLLLSVGFAMAIGWAAAATAGTLRDATFGGVAGPEPAG